MWAVATLVADSIDLSIDLSEMDGVIWSLVIFQGA